MNHSTAAGLCCLMLLAPAWAFAQDRGDRETASAQRYRECGEKAQQLPPGEQAGFMASCTNQGRPPTELEKEQLALSRECTQEAGARTGEERRRFIDSCIGRASSSPRYSEDLNARRERDREILCNRQADDRKLTGEARGRFMNSCRRGGVAGAGRSEEQKVRLQERENACNKAADDRKLTGEERGRFMSSCRRGGVASAGLAQEARARQDKENFCNKQADDRKLTGDERARYVRSCRAQ